VPTSVPVEILVEPAAAEALADSDRRDLVGRLVSRMLRPVHGEDPLAAVIARIKAKAHGAGLTDEIVDAELAAARAEAAEAAGQRRGRPSGDRRAARRDRRPG
jgi:hypothetical protein